MVSIVCDSCKKAIPGAHKDVNLFYYADKSLCAPCRDKLDVKIKEAMKKERTYSFQKYRDTMMRNLQGMCK